ncbi:MAG: acyl-CoA dehydrogenase [Candidatus Marinimicrobia bacterium]|nr:acyl-CoA dehydrogenase [Candidatus Neomarinimicrobiota bacterium]
MSKEQSNNTLFSNSPFTLEKLSGRGGSFLIVPVDRGQVFCREKFSEDQKMFEQAAFEFAQNKIKPQYKDLNKMNKDLSLQLFKEVGQLGFLGIDVPEKFGGIDLDKTAACIVLDALSSGKSASFMVTLSAHTGIGTLPIVWYGTDEQKHKYLPKIASGEYLACYALTEPNAGSDALAGSTVANLSEDGKHYILNGQKIYCTNGSWADVAITFAQVEGQYTAFILDKDCEGWNLGGEEDKMGIKGSSTATFFFENCKVPIENVLGNVGQGGPIAFNVLYAGRWKLGATTAAGAKFTINAALEFAKDRFQFEKSIKEFEMIQNKFSMMVTKAWESDSIVYMTSGSIDSIANTLDKEEDGYYVKLQKIIEDHAIEASACKVLCSENLAYIVDECVQVMGGAGFIEEYDAATLYRDERINRIFEGTNEINRLIVGSYALKKAILEELPIRDLIKDREENWIPELDSLSEDPSLKEAHVIEFCRSLFAQALNASINMYGQDLKNKQWIIEPLANVIISLCTMDTCYKRYKELNVGEHKDNTFEVLSLSISNHYNIIVENAKVILAYIDSENNDSALMSVFKNWEQKLNYNPNVISLKNAIVKSLYKYEKYYLDK